MEKKQKVTRIVEFQWILNGGYEPISNQFDEWIDECDLDEDPHFKIVQMTALSSKTEDKRPVETLFVAYTCSNYK